MFSNCASSSNLMMNDKRTVYIQIVINVCRGPFSIDLTNQLKKGK